MKEMDIRHRFLAGPKIANKFMDEVEDRLTSLEEGGGLPEVTSANNGDVLTVVEGVWNKATPSGGGGNIEFIEVTIDEQTSVATASYSDIGAAITAGKLPVLKVGSAPHTSFYVYQSSFVDDATWCYLFTGFNAQNIPITLNLWSVAPSNVITIERLTIS